MSLPGFVSGEPRIGTTFQATHRIVFRDHQITGALSLGRIIDGTLTRDPDNTGATTVLRAGLVMGKVTTSGKYSNAIIGLTNAAYAGGTSLTLTTQAAAELSRRVGSSGTFTIVGPAAANGPVQTEVVTYSSLVLATGVVTVTALANTYISGSFVGPNDGSQHPRTFLPDGYGITVLDSDMTTAIDQPFPTMPIAAVVESAQLINWPTDTGLQSWLVGELKEQLGGLFVFDHAF